MAFGDSPAGDGKVQLDPVRRSLVALAHQASAAIMARNGAEQLRPMMMFVQSTPTAACVPGQVEGDADGVKPLPIAMADASPFFADSNTKAALARVIQAVLEDRGQRMLQEFPPEVAKTFDRGVDTVMVVAEAWMRVGKEGMSIEEIRSLPREDRLMMMFYRDAGVIGTSVPIHTHHVAGHTTRSLGPLDEALAGVYEAESGDLVPTPPRERMS